MKEIEDAMVKVTMGPEKKTRVRSEKENRLVAYHEAGHAVVFTHSIFRNHISCYL